MKAMLRGLDIRKARGFTLLEVMVALMIFATAAVALSKSLTESASNTAALEERQFADLVANNLLIDILREGDGTKVNGKVSMAGFDFFWQRTVSATPHPKIRNVEISVRRVNGDNVLASRRAFLER